MSGIQKILLKRHAYGWIAEFQGSGEYVDAIKSLFGGNELVLPFTSAAVPSMVQNDIQRRFPDATVVFAIHEPPQMHQPITGQAFAPLALE